MVNLTIDNKNVSVPEGTTILTAAKSVGINIPTLCYLEKLNEIGACRICCVEVAGIDNLVAACNSEVEEGMTVFTNSPAVRAARRMNLQLILSEHDCHCPTCKRNGNCKLQQLAADFNIIDNPYKSRIPENKPTGVIIEKLESKCIKCMRCVNVCEEVQSLGVWSLLSSGKRAHVGVTPGIDMQNKCAYCGQCVTHCPTGALTARDDTSRVYDALGNKDKITVLQIAPAVRSAWAEQLGLSTEEATEKRMVAAAKALGFDFVFDTNFTADLTIMEEGNEFLKRLTTGGKLPMFTSCCPGWVRFMLSEYPEFSENLSTAKSPQQMFGAITKSYFAKKAGIDPEKIFCVSVMPCVAKKFEADVDVLCDAGAGQDVDAVITTREFASMIKADHINTKDLPEAEFDSPLGTGTGAAVIFGATGGVMEAALRTAVSIVTGKNPDADSFGFLRGKTNRREAELKVADKNISVAAVSGLAEARKIIEDIKSGKKHYDFVEIMACPGGCAGGGGQPIHDGKELALDRGEKLYTIDSSNALRFSHENPEIITVYDEFLGQPLGEMSHKLLHTDLKLWKL